MQKSLIVHKKVCAICEGISAPFCMGIYHFLLFFLYFDLIEEEDFNSPPLYV